MIMITETEERKTPSADGITNEWLKSGIGIIKKLLKKVFNSILTEKVIPQ